MKYNSELLSAVRRMKRMGSLEAATTHGNLLSEEGNKILARFALSVLEQKAIGCPYSDNQPVYALPPVPQPVKVQLPTSRLWAGKIDCYIKVDIIEALKAAGIEVKE